ncbi:DUF2789 family protein [Colwellia sp. BRX10-6]|nr:DUF2789 family protein [Colwellia sp. BRX8-9]MBA6384220.1 DUF2789 family protein [Colwellia sp. BRX10-9]MBA6394121.1 DUF2789 family protein [Colwellia sp. BRX10-6]
MWSHSQVIILKEAVQEDANWSEMTNSLVCSLG